MDDKIIQRIERKIGVPDIVELLSERLPGSDLNSLLLEVFSNKIREITPAMLLQQYQANRFVQPAETDMIELLEQELRILRFFRERGFQPLELSPVAQLGSCSVVATVDQKKVISAGRNTEIVADATNALALHIAALKKTGSVPDTEDSGKLLRYCTIHRHVRTPTIRIKGHTPHFKIGCLVTSGVDTGSYAFELASLEEQVRTWYDLLRGADRVSRVGCKLQGRGGNRVLLDRMYEHLREKLPDMPLEREIPEKENNYYKGIQFKIVIEMDGGPAAGGGRIGVDRGMPAMDGGAPAAGRRVLEIADGGFVDWTQQLLENSKERFLISGYGFVLLHKLQKGEIF